MRNIYHCDFYYVCAHVFNVPTKTISGITLQRERQQSLFDCQQMAPVLLFSLRRSRSLNVNDFNYGNLLYSKFERNNSNKVDGFYCLFFLFIETRLFWRNWRLGSGNTGTNRA